MYAIVKTGGKQYKVAAGDKLNIEKLDAEVGAKVRARRPSAVVDGEKVVADPAKAAVDEGQRPSVRRAVQGREAARVQVQEAQELQDARAAIASSLTRVEIESVGSAKAEKKVAKKAAPKKAEKAEEPASVDAE